MPELALSDTDFGRLDYDVEKAPHPERRKSDANMELVREMFAELKAMRSELKAHVASEKMIIIDAFPDADPDGHRLAHEAWIKKAEASAKFWEDMRSTLAKWGLIGLAGFFLAAGWRAFLVGPK